ncbi:hypothetical protein GP486_004449, partial [Trichoglossum hirsutum]
MESVGHARNDKVWLEQYCAQFPLNEFGLGQVPAPSLQGIPPSDTSPKEARSKPNATLYPPPKTGEISGSGGHGVRPQRDLSRAGGTEVLQTAKDKVIEATRVSRFSRLFSSQSPFERQPQKPKESKELKGLVEPKPEVPPLPAVVPRKPRNSTPVVPRHDYKLLTLGVEELTVECAIDRADLPPGEMYQLPECDCLICATCLEGAFRHGLEGEAYLCPAKCPNHSIRIPDELMEKCGKFSNQEVRSYKERVVEFSTLDK